MNGPSISTDLLLDAGFDEVDEWWTTNSFVTVDGPHGLKRGAISTSLMEILDTAEQGVTHKPHAAPLAIARIPSTPPTLVPMTPPSSPPMEQPATPPRSLEIVITRTSPATTQGQAKSSASAMQSLMAYFAHNPVVTQRPPPTSISSYAVKEPASAARTKLLEALRASGSMSSQSSSPSSSSAPTTPIKSQTRARPMQPRPVHPNPTPLHRRTAVVGEHKTAPTFGATSAPGPVPSSTGPIIEDVTDQEDSEKKKQKTDAPPPSMPTVSELVALDVADRAALLRLACGRSDLSLALRLHFRARPVPVREGLRLYPYQEQVQNWMAHRENSPPIHGIRGLILNLEMGLGKTPTMMLYLLWREPGPWPSLAVASLSVMGEWKRTAYKFLEPAFVERHILFLHADFMPQGRKIKDLRRADLRDIRLVVTTYDMITVSYRKLPQRIKDKCLVYRGDDKRTQIDEIICRDPDDSDEPSFRGLQLLHGVPWQRVICDEAQRIASVQSQTFRAVMTLPGRHRVHMTGTITRNYVTDIWALLRALGYTGITRKCEWNKNTAQTHYEKHGLRDVIYRLTYEEAGVTLPECQTHVVEVTLTARERQIYALIEKKTRDVFMSALSNMTSYANVLVMLLRLRQVAIAPWLINSNGAVDDMEAQREVDEEDSGDPEADWGATDNMRREKKQSLKEKLRARSMQLKKRTKEKKRGRGRGVKRGRKDGYLKEPSAKRPKVDMSTVMGGGLLSLSRGDRLEAAKINEETRQVMEDGEEGEEEDEDEEGDDLEPLSISSDEEDEEDEEDDIDSVSSSSSRSSSSSSANVRHEKDVPSDDGEELQMLFEHEADLMSYCREKRGDGGIGASKMRVAYATLRKFLMEHPGEKMITFSMFTSVLDLFGTLIDEARRRSESSTDKKDEEEWWWMPPEMRDLEVLTVDGKTTGKERSAIFERFSSSPVARLLMLSGKVGGEGLTLTCASAGMLFEHHWTPIAHKQMKARFWRIGQTRVSHWFELVTTDTIEQRVLQICHDKNEIAAMFQSNDSRVKQTKNGAAADDDNLLTMANIGRMLNMKM